MSSTLHPDSVIPKTSIFASPQPPVATTCCIIVPDNYLLAAANSLGAMSGKRLLCSGQLQSPVMFLWTASLWQVAFRRDNSVASADRPADCDDQMRLFRQCVFQQFYIILNCRLYNQISARCKMNNDHKHIP